jgi:hypothetical protein
MLSQPQELPFWSDFIDLRERGFLVLLSGRDQG